MAVADVEKIRIITHKNDKDKVVSFLYGAGLMEISKFVDQEEKREKSKIDENIGELEYKISEIQSAISFLEEYREKEKLNLISRLTKAMIPISAESIKGLLKTFNLDGIIKEVGVIEDQISKSKSQLDKIRDENETLQQWSGLDVKISEMQETKYAKNIFGIIDSEKYLDFIRKIEKKILQAEVKKISSQESKDYFIITYNKSFDKNINRIFFNYGVEKVELPNIEGTPKNTIRDNNLAAKKIDKDNNELKKAAAKIAKKNLHHLKILYDHYKWSLDKLIAEKDFFETGQAVFMSGWIDKDNIKKICADLENITNNFYIERIKPKKGEEVPVIMKNSDFMRPFEAITNLYGLPKKTEVDPTPFLSVFFIIFFGLCLTDAGYGLILMTLTYLAIKVLKIPKEKQRLIRLLMYGGFVTVIVGALTGGWFGIVINDLPENFAFIKTVLNSIQIVDPINDPITMLILSFVLGFIQIWFGIAIDMWWKIKNKQVLDGILDSGVWLYFLSAIAFYGVVAFGLLSSGFKSIAFYLVIFGVILVVLTQGRKQKNVFLKLLSGIGSLYGLVGYMSDILSYSRLLALGLATAVIAMVINLIAVMFKDMVPVVGWILMILILVGGHLFNIVINVLGAYIHSGRLQFVEFFPKFFKGGGKIFRPFRRESKYVNLKDN